MHRPALRHIVTVASAAMAAMLPASIFGPNGLAHTIVPRIDARSASGRKTIATYERLRASSKYMPHQSERECARRIRQGLARPATVPSEVRR